MKFFSTLRSVLRFRKFETDPVARRLQSVASVSDLRDISKRRLPGGVFDYIDGAAEDEVTLRRNSEAYSCLLYTSPSPRDLSTSRMPSSA